MDVLFDKNEPGDNPFADDALPLAHYYPSTQRQLTKGQKEVRLTANHQKTSKTNPPSKSKVESLKHASPSERRFLQATNTMLARELPTHDTPSPRDTSAKFDESWPTSERPSTIESPSDISHVSSKQSSVKLSDYLKRPATSSSSVGGWGSDDISRDVEQWRSSLAKKESTSKESTLAKYIHRFRHSEPKSRDERARDKASASREFWWMSPPSHSSTPTDDSAKRHTDRSSSGKMGSSHFQQRSPYRAGHILPRSGIGKGAMLSSSLQKNGKTTIAPSSSSYASSVLDDSTAQLQARADKLVEKSESTLLSEPAVSSEGVGLSPSSATTDDSFYIPQIPHTQADTESHIRQDIQSTVRPEDDILYQWRVRRRLEQARQRSEANVDPGMNRGELHITRVQSKESEDDNSKLEDFRRRIKQQQMLSQSRQGITTLPVETNEPVRHMGTDPIPQSIATQTNGMLPSSGTSVLPSSGHNVLNPPDNIQSVPVAKGRSHDEYVGYEQDVPVRDNAESQRGKMSQFETVDQTVFDARHGGRKHIIASPHIERTSAPGRGQSSSVAPHWHLACDIIPCEQSNPHKHGEDAAKKRDRDGLSHKEQSGDIGVKKPYHHGVDLEHQRTRHDQHGRKMKTVKQGTDVLQDDAKIHPQFQDRDDVEESQRQKRLENHPRQRLDFENVADVSPSTPPQRLTKVRVHGVDDGMVRDERLPMRHVAPSPVSSAIGQVISSRLFTSTPTPGTHSPESSVDTLPSMQHSPSTQSGSIPANDDDSESTSSDGAFGDDELLQMLRRRRAEYEQQLQHLDQLIEKAQ
ncbi:uncharacterized protein [Amphiura filiformis]|uniref:uncharacterized protein n=1 Tax=Amphiura filiformis TaxID=82378 RepID=UPI003B20D2E6